MDKIKIISLLKDYPVEHAEAYASYLFGLSQEKDRATGQPKNAWLNYKNDNDLANFFMRVAKDGLVFDGKHITLQSTGISYDYIAYKNKMLLAYPESKVDMAIVYTGDDFTVSKENGSIIYHHNITNPFNQKEENIVGAYCVIINKRGEFITLLSQEEIIKHRKVAKTDYIWKNWIREMTLKTVIKKACKQHFADIYELIEEKDNENYNLDNPIKLDLQYKSEIDDIKSVEELKEYYNANKGKGKDFDKYITIRKAQLI